MPSTRKSPAKSRRTSQPKRKPAPVAAPAVEAVPDAAPPEPIVAEQAPVETASQVEASAAAGAPDGAPEASGPEASPPAEVASAVQAAAPAIEPAAPVTEAIVAPAPTAKEVPVVTPAVESPAGPTAIRLGQVDGLLHRLPLGELLPCLDAFEVRIATLRDSQAVVGLQERVRATEGQCAPIFFTEDEDGDPEHLISGIETVAAAMNLGLECVFVVTVAPSDADALQGHLNTALNQPATSPDDDLFARVASYHK